MNCDYCGKEIKEIPFKCHRCGGYHCEDHRLYENHNCIPIGRRWGAYKKESKKYKNKKKSLIKININR